MEVNWGSSEPALAPRQTSLPVKTARVRDHFRDQLAGGVPGPAMVAIEAGSFLMGSPREERGRFPDETPQHLVALARSFAIGKFAVTYGEYRLYCAATGSPLPDQFGNKRKPQPVINVSWHDARSFACWLSEESGRCYRLPSEAEWEYAARAGTRGPFSFNSAIDTSRANYCGLYSYPGCGKGDYRRKPLDVGSLPANPWGLHEVHGNVAEWVEDHWHDSYCEAPSDGTAWVGAETLGPRVVRGGSWYSTPWRVRSAYRGWFHPEGRINDLGFRLACSL